MGAVLETETIFSLVLMKNFLNFYDVWIPCNYLVHGARKHQCPQCDTDFTTLARLNLHIRRIHLKPYKCDKCSRGFGVEKELEIHRKYVHFGVKPFKCEKFGCNNAYPTKEILKRKVDDRAEFCY